MNTLIDFIRESNRIEGILREPTRAEIDAHSRFVMLPEVAVEDLASFVAAVQPDAVLRDRPGLNVRVGDHTPIAGGPVVIERLVAILRQANAEPRTSYMVHHAYETLHPFTDGNGRSGRALWLWMNGGRAPLGFLHAWYYQSLRAGDRG